MQPDFPDHFSQQSDRNNYVDVPFPFTRIAAPPFQITCAWNLHHLLNYVATWSAVRRYTARTGTDDMLRNAAPALLPHWGEPETIRNVTMPLTVLVGRGEAG
jgi:hypothetical protein